MARQMMSVVVVFLLFTGVCLAKNPYFEQVGCYRVDNTGQFKWQWGQAYYMENIGNDVCSMCVPAPFSDAYIESVFQYYFDLYSSYTGIDFAWRGWDRLVDGAEGQMDNTDGMSEVHWGHIQGPWQMKVFYRLRGKPSGRGIYEVSLIINPDWPWGDASDPDCNTTLDSSMFVYPTVEFYQRDDGNWVKIIETHVFDWGDAETECWDFESAVAQWVGLWVGLDFVDSDSTHFCDEETMYRLFEPGEWYKRTLGEGDVEGVEVLYGN